MSDLAALDQSLRTHEERSRERFEHLSHLITEKSPMTAGTDHVKIENIMQPGHGGGDGGLSFAALAPLMAQASRHGGDWGGLGGGGIVGGLLLGALLGNRGGLFGGRDGDCRPGENLLDVAALQKLGTIEGAVPLAAAQTQAAVSAAAADINSQTQAQTISLGGQIAGAKDAVQNLALFLSNQLNTVNQNVSAQGCETREVVQAGTTAVLSAIKDGTIANLQAELVEARSSGRARESEVTITQSVNQVQAQTQAQAQQQQILTVLSGIAAGLGNLTQIAHATNSNIIAGNTGAVTTGPQSANPVNVRA